MRKAFNKNQNALLEIKPIEDLEPIVPEGIPEPQKINYKHEEVFVNKKVRFENHDEQITNDDEETQFNIEIQKHKDNDNSDSVSMVIEEKPIKRGRGKRGKDKKPRVKKPPTEKQLAHLKRMREISRQKREAKKLEKERLKKEMAEKVKQNVSTNRKVDLPIPKKNIKMSVNKKQSKPINIDNPINPDNINPPNYESFFKLMDQYHEYREKKEQVKKVIPKSQPHPSNRVIKKQHRPKKPIHNPLKNNHKVQTNPFDICFSYGSNTY